MSEKPWYIVIEAHGRGVLCDRVNARIGEGYVPIGGVTVTKWTSDAHGSEVYTVVQAMMLAKWPT